MIELDIESALDESLHVFVSDAFITYLLYDIADAARAKWIGLAQRQLKTSKADYIKGIQKVRMPGQLEAYIALTGWLPNAVEQGLDPFDLRETLLADKHKGVKKNKQGQKYRPIPFRHQTPGTEGSAGMPMGERYGPMGPMSLAWGAEGLMAAKDAKRLGKRVYKAALQLEGKQRLKTRETKGKGFVQVPKLAPWHKTDIYQGMIRARAPYEKVEQTGGYITFRTISEANQVGWIHPGIQARQLIPQVERHINSIAEAAIRAAWESFGGPV